LNTKSGERDDNFQVILPCAPNDFGTFIAGLLGKPKTLKGAMSGHFTINEKQISNFYHLIHQKINSQNHGNLINLSISVYYSNGLSVTHHNATDFESYYPTAKAHPTQIVISFVYLIQFNGKAAAEKQEIDITISTDRDESRDYRLHWSHSGLCKYSISHTDTSWATDISNIIKSHSESIIDKPGIIKEHLTTSFGDILRGGTSALYILLLIYWAKYANWKIPVLPDLDSKILFIVNSSIIFTISYLICKSVIYLIDMNLTLHGNSYICLTDKDYEYKTISMKSFSRRWIYYFAGWAANISCGILASVIFGLI
jgi:hypothetical protein